MNLKTILEQAPAKVEKVIAEQKAYVWDDSVRSGLKPISEMIGTGDGAAEFVEKTTYDVYTGRENVPLLYKDIYRTISDSNLPKTLTEKEFGYSQVVFLEHFEGGEVKFGDMTTGPEATVTMRTWAAGIEYSEDMVEYNEYWRLSEVSESFGESYNKLLNHLHLYPIVGGSYTTTGGGIAAQKVAQDAGTAQLVAYDTDIATTFKNALRVLPNVSKVLINSADRELILAALAGDMYDDLSAAGAKRKITPDMLVEYDGETVTVGSKEYEYTGVASGFVYFVVGKRNFREYIKHDLRIDSGDGDLSRLIVDQLVGRARRGVLATLGGKNGAVKVDIAA